MVKDNGRNSTGGSYLSSAGKYLSALCLDLWVNQWRKGAHGDVIIIRYADDWITGFQYQNEATRFRQELQERLAGFGLEMHNEKTRILEFGRFASANRAKRGDGKPETFDFFGIHTHLCNDQEEQ